MNTWKLRISLDLTKENKFLVPCPGYSRMDFAESPLGLSSATDYVEWFSQYFAARSELVTRIQSPQSLKQNKYYGFKILKFLDNDNSEFSWSWGVVRFSDKSLLANCLYDVSLFLHLVTLLPTAKFVEEFSWQEVRSKCCK